MHRSSGHRIVVLSLAFLFALFNVGLPIVVASCPMAGMKDGGCDMCYEKDAGTAMILVPLQDRSCCETVIAAEQNEEEFLRVPAFGPESDHCILISYRISSGDLPGVGRPLGSTSDQGFFLRGEKLRILVSSLLI
jgi:hypothetical protein